MTAPTDVEALVGVAVYISATLPDTYDAAGYQSTDIVWTEVTEVESIAPNGGTKQINTFTPVKTGTVKKRGGSTDYGNLSLVLGKVTTDPGQILLRTAFNAGNIHYSMKVVYDDGAAATDEMHFYDVIVTTFEDQNGDANTIRKVNVTAAICLEPVVVDPT